MFSQKCYQKCYQEKRTGNPVLFFAVLVVFVLCLDAILAQCSPIIHVVAFYSVIAPPFSAAITLIVILIETVLAHIDSGIHHCHICPHFPAFSAGFVHHKYPPKKW